MADNEKLISTRTELKGAEESLDLAGAEDLFIAELDDRLELSVLLVNAVDVNGISCKPNQSCNVVSGCT